MMKSAQGTDFELLSSVPCISKFHRFTTCEERRTQDEGPRVQQARQQGRVLPVEGPDI